MVDFYLQGEQATAFVYGVVREAEAKIREAEALKQEANNVFNKQESEFYLKLNRLEEYLDKKHPTILKAFQKQEAKEGSPWRTK